MKDAFTVIALDGGAASGKSSTARALARDLKFLACDTGEHYRALTYLLLQAKVPPKEPQVQAFLNALQRSTSIYAHSARICLNGKTFDYLQLKSPEVNASVSKYAALPCLRAWLLEYQRSYVDLARKEGFRGLVMEGRDIGSVVLPKADYRFFLVADEATCQRRRDAQGVVDVVSVRNAQDQSRKTAPLVAPPGSITVDTSEHTLEDVVQCIMSLL